MNPWWVGGLALLVLLEKVVPRGELLGRVAGLARVVPVVAGMRGI